MSSRAQGARIHVGSASIVAIFAVLCLTVFAVLTLSTAVSEQRLAEKSAQAVEDYYKADLKCAQIAQGFYDAAPAGAQAVEMHAAQTGAQVFAQGEARYVAFSQAIDAQQQLDVMLLIQDGQVRVLRWQAAFIGQWVPQDDLPVWDGE